MDAGRTYTLCGTLDYKATFALELMNFVETMMNVALKMMESDGKIICCISFDEFCTGTLDYMAPEVLQNKVSKSDELCVKNDELFVKNDALCVKNDEFFVKNDEALY